jgi:NAD(P)-dependent dehydrogenase (short-subunit alcohol dehydrogenase family)
VTHTAVITGASSGIGASAAASLAASGWDVAVVGRNPERTNAVAKSIGGTPFIADFDRLDDVRLLASTLRERFERIDVLANNAGGLVHKRGVSADGFERTIQLNHLAPFLLTNLLLPTLEASGARVIGTASIGNNIGNLRLDDLQFEARPWMGGWRAYGTSKIATIVFARELAARSSVESYSFHPGYVATEFGSDAPFMRLANALTHGRLALTAAQGAAPLVHLATVASVDAENGTYFDRFTPNGRVHASARVPGLGAELWRESARLVGATSDATT